MAETENVTAVEANLETSHLLEQVGHLSFLLETIGVDYDFYARSRPYVVLSVICAMRTRT